MTPDAPRYCRSCGKPLVPGATFCRGCGARTPVPAAPAEPAAPAVPAPPAPTPPAAEPPPAPRAQPPVAPPAPLLPSPTPPGAPPTQPISAAAAPPRPTPPPPLPDEPSPKPRRRGRTIAIAVLVVLLVGGAAAAAIVLLGGDDSKQTEAAPRDASTVPETTDVPTRTGEAGSPSEAAAAATTAGTIGAGRYVQAGSFRTVAGAEAERQRLEDDGIRVMVVESDQTQELYPGFQVLLGGPFTSSGPEQAMVRQLHGDAVPSAFGRALSPAAEIAGPEAITGNWTGTLERSGSSNPALDGPLPVTLSAAADGQLATLEFGSLSCEVELALRDATDVSLTYGQEGGCVGGGAWRLRPSGEELSLVLLPPDSEEIVLGILDRR
jgi:hypothetical protein